MSDFPDKWKGSLLLAADSIDKLRASDVERVLLDVPENDREELGRDISRSRPDLSDEIADIMEETCPSP